MIPFVLGVIIGAFFGGIGYPQTTIKLAVAFSIGFATHRFFYLVIWNRDPQKVSNPVPTGDTQPEIPPTVEKVGGISKNTETDRLHWFIVLFLFLALSHYRGIPS